MAARNNSSDMTTVFHAKLNGIFIEIQSNPRRKKLHKTNQGSNFLGGSFSNGDNVRAQIQFRREIQLQHLIRWFFLKNKPIIFTSITPVLSDWSNKTSWVFSALKSTRHFVPQSTVSCRQKLLKKTLWSILLNAVQPPQEGSLLFTT